MRMKTTNIALLLATLIFMLSGCIREVIGDRSGDEDLTVRIKTRAFVGSDQEGTIIKTVRFMLFSKNTHNILLNSTTSGKTLNINDQGVFTVKTAPGKYFFVAVINETPELTDKLNKLSNISEIASVTFDWKKDVLTQNDIPMVNFGDMTIVPGATSGIGEVTVYQRYKEDGFFSQSAGYEKSGNPVIINVPRTLSRISLYLRKGDNVSEDVVINSVQVSNLPSFGYLWQQVYNDNTTEKVNLFTGTKNITSAGGNTEHNSNKYEDFSSAVIPDKGVYDVEGNPYEDAFRSTFSAYISINASFGGAQTTYKVLLHDKEYLDYYRLERNTNYNVYATITQMGSKGIYAVIEPVKMHEIEVGWQPVEGLVIVSEREDELGKNINVLDDHATYTGVLKVNKGSDIYDVLFKYGSLIGIHNDVAATTTKPFIPPTGIIMGDIAWYPGQYYFPAITDWSSIPYISDGSNITNTVDLVSQGKGDPCRLAIFSPAQISGGMVDNGQWHMATPAEYDILMMAERTEQGGNDNGYPVFGELLIPDVKYRNESGILQATHGFQGNYWTSEANKAFTFNSRTLTKGVSVVNPQNAYAIRCVRNSIPSGVCDISRTEPSMVPTGGTPDTGLSGFTIVSNVPYWKLELITSGDNVGTATAFDDFSFAPFTEPVKHSVIGSYSKEIKYHVKKWYSFPSRNFVLKLTYKHIDGTGGTIVDNSLGGKTVIWQKELRYETAILVDGYENCILPAESKKYTIKVTVKPVDDTVIPAGLNFTIALQNVGEATFPPPVESNVITTEKGKYEYMTEIEIPSNATSDMKEYWLLPYSSNQLGLFTEVAGQKQLYYFKQLGK